MLAITSETKRMIRVAIRGRYSPNDGIRVLDLLEKYSAVTDPPGRYYFDLSEMTEFGLGYSDVMEQAKRTMKLRFTQRVVFGIYTTSAVTRGFATVFSKFIDASKVKVVVSDDRTLVERELM